LYKLLQTSAKKLSGVQAWGDEYVVDALRKLIPFLFRSFYNWLIFKLKKIDGIKTGSELASLSVTFSSAQCKPALHSGLAYQI